MLKLSRKCQKNKYFNIYLHISQYSVNNGQYGSLFCSKKKQMSAIKMFNILLVNIKLIN